MIQYTNLLLIKYSLNFRWTSYTYTYGSQLATFVLASQYTCTTLYGSTFRNNSQQKTFVHVYGSTFHILIDTKVLSTKVRKYFRTKEIEGTFVRRQPYSTRTVNNKYESTLFISYEGTKVLSKVRKYQLVYVTVYVTTCTYVYFRKSEVPGADPSQGVTKRTVTRLCLFLSYSTLDVMNILL